MYFPFCMIVSIAFHNRYLIKHVEDCFGCCISVHQIIVDSIDRQSIRPFPNWWLVSKLRSGRKSCASRIQVYLQHLCHHTCFNHNRATHLRTLTVVVSDARINQVNIMNHENGCQVNFEGGNQWIIVVINPKRYMTVTTGIRVVIQYDICVTYVAKGTNCSAKCQTSSSRGYKSLFV